LKELGVLTNKLVDVSQPGQCYYAKKLELCGSVKSLKILI